MTEQVRRRAEAVYVWSVFALVGAVLATTFAVWLASLLFGGPL